MVAAATEMDLLDHVGGFSVVSLEKFGVRNAQVPRTCAEGLMY
jgi:hypothetical protein